MPCKTRDGMGSAFVFNALKQGEVDCYVDYTGTIWSNYMKRESILSPAETAIDVASFLRENNIICLGTLGFSNDYVFATRAETADERRLRTLIDTS